jgi:hypothetical protein
MPARGLGWYAANAQKVASHMPHRVSLTYHAIRATLSKYAKTNSKCEKLNGDVLDNEP